MFDPLCIEAKDDLEDPEDQSSIITQEKVLIKPPKACLGELLSSLGLGHNSVIHHLPAAIIPMQCAGPFMRQDPFGDQ